MVNPDVSHGICRTTPFRKIQKGKPASDLKYKQHFPFLVFAHVFIYLTGTARLNPDFLGAAESAWFEILCLPKRWGLGLTSRLRSPRGLRTPRHRTASRAPGRVRPQSQAGPPRGGAGRPVPLGRHGDVNGRLPRARQPLPPARPRATRRPLARREGRSAGRGRALCPMRREGRGRSAREGAWCRPRASRAPAPAPVLLSLYGRGRGLSRDPRWRRDLHVRAAAPGKHSRRWEMAPGGAR